MEKRLDGTDLKGKERKYFDRLAVVRQDLFEDLKVHSSSSLSVERESGGDVADVGTDDYMREFELGLMTEEGKRVQLIQDAIERLYDGTYGKCLDCKKKISEGRLEALPYAKLCIGCKSKREELLARGEILDPDDVLTE